MSSSPNPIGEMEAENQLSDSDCVINIPRHYNRTSAAPQSVSRRAALNRSSLPREFFHSRSFSRQVRVGEGIHSSQCLHTHLGTGVGTRFGFSLFEKSTKLTDVFLLFVVDFVPRPSRVLKQGSKDNTTHED